MKRLSYTLLLSLALVGAIYLSFPYLPTSALSKLINSDHFAIVSLRAGHPRVNDWQISHIQTAGIGWKATLEGVALSYEWVNIAPKLKSIRVTRGSIALERPSQAGESSGGYYPETEEVFGYLFRLPADLAIDDLEITAPGTKPIKVSARASGSFLDGMIRITLPDQPELTLNIRRDLSQKTISVDATFPKSASFVSGDLRVIPGSTPLELEISTSEKRETRATINLKTVEQLSSGFSLNDLSARLLISPEGLSSRTPILVRRVQVGAEIRALRFDLIASASRIRLSDVSAEFLAGQVKLKQAAWEMNKPSSAFVLELEGLSLKALNELRDSSNLMIEGFIDGSLPIVIEGKNVFVNSGQITAREPGGTIRYLDQETSGLAGGSQSLALIVSALKNYQYDSLSAVVDYQPTGELTTTVALKGRNPDFQNGQRIDLNIKLEENLLDLIRSLRLATDIDGKIGSKLLSQDRAPAVQKKVR